MAFYFHFAKILLLPETKRAAREGSPLVLRKEIYLTIISFLVELKSPACSR